MEYSDIYKKLTNIRVAKNADYGDSFGKSFREFGMIAPVIRMSDKVERLKSIRHNAFRVTDESVDDTLLDLANYAIMTYYEIQAHRDSIAMTDSALEALR